MKYTRKEANAKIEELDNEIVKLMSKMDEIRSNTIDNDKEDLAVLVDLFEEASDNVQAKFYAYILDNFRFKYGFFV